MLNSLRSSIGSTDKDNSFADQTMLTPVVVRLLEEMGGKVMPSLMEEATGVSAKTWKAGGPQSPAVIRRAETELIGRHLDRLQTHGGHSYDEAVAIHRATNWKERGAWLMFVRWELMPNDSRRCPKTEELARTIDELDSQLTECRLADDLVGYRQLLLASGLLDVGDEWLRSVEEIDAGTLKRGGNASWDSLTPVINATLKVALLRLLACWDVEFQSRYLTESDKRRGLTPRPLFQYVLPALKTGAKLSADGKYPAHGLFRLPLRRAIELTYCLATYHREKRWPKANEVTRTMVAAAGGKTLHGENHSEQPLAKIHLGSRGLTSAEFADIWQSMCGGKPDEKTPLPPWPVYVVAQLWTVLFVEKGNRKNTPRAVSITVQDDQWYRYWWDKYLAEFKRQGTFFGNDPWPDYSAVI